MSKGFLLGGGIGCYNASVTVELETFRRERAMSYAELAKAIRCSAPMAYLLCNGQRTPSLKLAVRIEQVTADWWKGPIRPHQWVAPEAA